MIEALACGTPVLALTDGSVPAVVQHGVTGFIADTEDTLVESVQQRGSLDRLACRQDVERRFSAEAMATAYECVYEQLVQAANNHRIMDLSPLARAGADEVDASADVEVLGAPG